MKRNAAADKFGEIQEQIQSRLEQAGGDLNVLAKEFNLATGEVPKFLRGAGGAPLGTAQPLQDIVFGDSPLQPGHIGGPVLVGEDRLVLVKVTESQQAGSHSRWRKYATASWPRSRRTAARRRLSRRPRTLRRSCRPARRSTTLPSNSACHRGAGSLRLHAPIRLFRPQLRELVFNSPKPNRQTGLQGRGVADRRSGGGRCRRSCGSTRRKRTSRPTCQQRAHAGQAGCRAPWAGRCGRVHRGDAPHRRRTQKPESVRVSGSAAARDTMAAHQPRPISATPILVAMVIGAVFGWLVGPEGKVAGVEVLGFFDFLGTDLHQPVEDGGGAADLGLHHHRRRRRRLGPRSRPAGRQDSRLLCLYDAPVGVDRAHSRRPRQARYRQR